MYFKTQKETFKIQYLYETIITQSIVGTRYFPRVQYALIRRDIVANLV